MGENKERSIRFINSRYQDLFHIPDGSCIRVVLPHTTFVQKCRYIDAYHTQIGNSIYHICEYAEMLERADGRCEPEGETYLDKAAWKIDGMGYLLIEKREFGYSYEVLRKDYSSTVQGNIEQPSKTMNEAREHVLESLSLDQRTLYPASFDELREKMKSVLKASEIRQIVWIDSKYYPHVRTAVHTLMCMVRGEALRLTYEVSRHDDGEGFTIHSDGKDIWDRMPESELRILEPVLASAVEFGHWKKDIDKADTPVAIQDVRFSLYETENSSLSREQIGQLHRMIDRKEETLAREQGPPETSPAGKSQTENTAPVENATTPQTEGKTARRKGR